MSYEQQIKAYFMQRTVIHIDQTLAQYVEVLKMQFVEDRQEIDEAYKSVLTEIFGNTQ